MRRGEGAHLGEGEGGDESDGSGEPVQGVVVEGHGGAAGGEGDVELDHLGAVRRREAHLGDFLSRILLRTSLRFTAFLFDLSHLIDNLID